MGLFLFKQHLMFEAMSGAHNYEGRETNGQTPRLGLVENIDIILEM